GGGYEPSTARAFPGGQDATRAVDYIRAWRDMELVRRTVNAEIFEKQGVDAVAAPVVRHGVPTIEEELATSPAGGGGGGGRGGRGGGGGGGAPAAGAAAESRPRYGDPEENTRPFNGYGLPAISVPCGFTKDGMPVGLQLCGPRFGEINLLALAH